MTMQRVAMITAASRGIGAGCARELAAQGYTVSLLARSPQIFDLTNELGGIATQGSMTNPFDLERFVTATLTQYGRIDAVVNSFADPPRPDLLSISDALWTETFEMLFLSVVRIAKLVTAPMQQVGGGAIVNISACDAFHTATIMFSGTIPTLFFRLIFARVRERSSLTLAKINRISRGGNDSRSDNLQRLATELLSFLILS